MRSGQPIALTSEPLTIFYYDVFNGRPLLIALDARGAEMVFGLFLVQQEEPEEAGRCASPQRPNNGP